MDTIEYIDKTYNMKVVLQFKDKPVKNPNIDDLIKNIIEKSVS